MGGLRTAPEEEGKRVERDFGFVPGDVAREEEGPQAVEEVGG